MVTLLDNGINTNFRHISNTNKQKQPKKNPEKNQKLVKSINVKIDKLTAKRNDIWKYYFKAILIVDMKSFIRLFGRIDRKYGPF